ncbi:Zinc finger PHD-type [Arabidopsis suecica]|uniref:Zinc finger PHD-type n=1 Tax=Arabidopsis suecica TaxID=45249 RepID=A0A8T2BR37_ARASU|nr:Zinc finger PHD-type [Arabidopsis suecica]
MEPPNSDSLCDRSVTGNLDLDNWIWIIEYFAKFKTELWMLNDVFDMAPKLPDYLGEYTNEMVAFRCLASLFASHVVSEADSKIEFDSSESCEYVLQCILDEIPLSELKPGAPGLSKWNLQPFIKSKLLCLPKCVLELMIEPSSCEDDTEMSPCNEEEILRSDGKETDRVTPPMGRREDGQSLCRGLGDGADEISRSHELLERRNEGYRDESGGHLSSPAEKIYRCVKCKESRKLLFCSSDGCEVMVHQKCLDSPPSYDDAGNFYCSLCAITCASAEYVQSQDEVAKAKKKLVSFLRLMSEVNKKKSIEGT